MRKGIIFFVIGITLILLSALFFQSFSPLNLEKVQELIIQNEIQPGDEDRLNDVLKELRLTGKLTDYLNGDFFVGFIIALSGIFLIFNTFHLTIDKLFFKNFYEKASLFDSIRRGLLLCISLFVFSILSLIGYTLNDILLGAVLILLVEILFAVYFKSALVKFFQRNYNKTKKSQ